MVNVHLITGVLVDLDHTVTAEDCAVVTLS